MFVTVCVCVCVNMCVHTCAYVCVYTWQCVCVCVCVCVCICVHVLNNTCLLVFIRFINVCTYIHTLNATYVCYYHVCNRPQLIGTVSDTAVGHVNSTSTPTW